MNKKIYRLLSIFTILAILSLACNLSTAKTSEPTQGKDTPPPAVTKPPKSTPTDAVQLGEEQRVETGGFSFRPVPGYNVQTEPMFSMVTMMPEGADAEVGPALLLVGAPVDATKIKEVKDLYDVAKEGMGKDTTISEPRPLIVDGKPGLEADVSETRTGKELVGKVAVVLVSKTQEFSLIGVAEKELWDKEVRVYFDAVLKSVKFFEMTLPTGLPDLPTDLPDLLTDLPDLGLSPEVTLNLPDQTETPGGSGSDDLVGMFAIAVSNFSSQFGEASWSANQAVDAPNVESCGDNGMAWASLGSDTVEWIELVFMKPVTPTEVEIYITYNPNQVTKVELLDILGQYHTIYTGEPKAEDQCPFVFKIKVDKADYKAIGVKITIDQSVLKSWCEIDAVNLSGTP